jgi:stage V sporulation protein S
MDIIKVAATSRSTAVAGAIAGVMREKGQVDVQAIGAGAVNQATKAVIIACGYLELDGIDIVCVPSFVEIMIDDQERTAVRLSVEKRSGSRGRDWLRGLISTCPLARTAHVPSSLPPPKDKSRVTKNPALFHFPATPPTGAKPSQGCASRPVA